MSEKIYVITRGDYSDYHIITATTDKKIADKIAKKFNAEVETYDDSEIYLKDIYVLGFNPQGNVAYCDKATSEYDYPISDRIYYTGDSKKNICVRLEVEADDEQSAIKIGAEKRAKFLAEQEGIL